MENSIATIKAGTVGTITQFMDGVIAGRLMTMGVLVGSKVEVVRKAPMKGGVYLKVDNQNMVMREQEAATVILSITE